MPVLHRNEIKILGMREWNCYIGFKRIDDILIALDKSQTLTTWDLTTGKVIGNAYVERDLQLQEY